MQISTKEIPGNTLAYMTHFCTTHDYIISIKGSCECLWNLGSIFIYDFKFIVPKDILLKVENHLNILLRWRVLGIPGDQNIMCLHKIPTTTPLNAFIGVLPP